MTYRQYAEAADFLDVMLPVLEKDEAAHNLMLGLAHQLLDSRYIQNFIPLYATLEEGGKTLLAALQTPPKRLVLYGAESAGDEAVDAMASRLLSHNPMLPGVIGPSAVTAAFGKRWTSLKGCRGVVSMRQRVYKLQRVRHRSNAPGRLRLASVEELGLMSRWIVRFMESIGEPVTYEEAVKRAKSRIARRDLFIWENERIVSTATKTRPTRSGIVISGVYTPPPLRRKGYATACVSGLSRALLESGYRFCSLFADLANPHSNRIYQKIGYEPVCDYIAVDFI